MMFRREFKNSTELWEYLNEGFIQGYHSFDLTSQGEALYIYDRAFHVEKPEVDDSLDFGRLFNYSNAKWKHLVNNYIDIECIKGLKASISSKKLKLDKNPLKYDFLNSKKNGKGCLISLIISKRPGQDKPNLFIHLRACEITKRLIVDLLFFQRIGEYLFGSVDNFTLSLFFNYLWSDNTILLMYVNHNNYLQKLNKYNWTPVNGNKMRLKKIQGIYEKYKYLPTLESVKYKVYRRVLKVLRPDLVDKYPQLLVKECKLPE